MNRIAAKLIVPIANISATLDAEAVLHSRGISYVPGFVANSGGVFCWRLAQLGSAAREDMIRRGLKQKIVRLVNHADSMHQSIALTARQIAEKNLVQMKRAESGGLWVRLGSLLQKLSPRRIGYAVGANVLNARWSRRSNAITRWYFDARYFD